MEVCTYGVAPSTARKVGGKTSIELRDTTREQPPSQKRPPCQQTWMPRKGARWTSRESAPQGCQ